ncbi:DUF485 domain-containing protein [Metabacillus mangrovi]|uniref:DUF485 domain-containing protein n=1 Tax=Metabacillus mangrovi TaxID=1491830 RepID=UPI001F4F662C|nr:DUF485 domain-containing protein [Metabacillus mangrovi]
MDRKEEAQAKVQRKKGARIDYTAVAASPAFQQLLAEKKKFILPLTLFFLAFYFTLPVLTAYSTVLNNPAIGAVSWAWIFAFAQFIMTWVLCSLYSRKAVSFDKLVEEIRSEAKQ